MDSDGRPQGARTGREGAGSSGKAPQQARERGVELTRWKLGL